MKSAYELAMERMERESGPTRKLSDGQKTQMAEIDATCDALAAEARLGYDAKVAAAQPAEREALASELATDLERAESRRTREKEAIWQQGDAS